MSPPDGILGSKGHGNTQLAKNLPILTVFDVLDERGVALPVLRCNFTNVDAVAFDLFFEVDLLADDFSKALHFLAFFEGKFEFE